jgi:hypothetical protein
MLRYNLDVEQGSGVWWMQKEKMIKISPKVEKKF